MASALYDKFIDAKHPTQSRVENTRNLDKFEKFANNNKSYQFLSLFAFDVNFQKQILLLSDLIEILIDLTEPRLSLLIILVFKYLKRKHFL